MKRTPLYDRHVAAGARMVEFAGWDMPVQYTSIVGEHTRVRTSAGLFDVSHMGEIEIRGKAAVECCLRTLSNDVRRLAVGQAQYSLIPNERGGVVDDVLVYHVGADRYLLCVNAANTEKDVAWLREHAPSQAEIVDRSDELALLALQGPRAVDILVELFPRAARLARYGCAWMKSGGVRALVGRTGYTGEDGFELFVGAVDAVRLWDALLHAGARHGLAPAGLGARDTLRLEAALPLYGHELDEDISPYEVRLGWAVKLNRRELVGYEALAAARGGRIARKLVGLEMRAGIARRGCAVVACGAPVGKVTSGSYCPTIGRAVALALVAREADLREGEVEVEVRKRLRPARVTNIPFYVSGAARRTTEDLRTAGTDGD